MSPFYLFTQEAPIVISFKVKTRLSGEGYPMLVANKEWNRSTTFEIDLTSTSNYGKTLTTGMRRGWAVHLQPNGAWAWNLGNEKNRLDYLPSQKQSINDGLWHDIQLVYKTESTKLWLYLDGQLVAIYNYASVEVDPVQLLENIKATDNPEIKIKGLKIKRKWNRPQPSLETKKDTLRIISWNIWHGGRRNGIDKGIRQTIKHLKAKTPDVICMQETYGSGPIIADSLGMTFFYISTNLSIMSALPFVETYTPWDDFRFGGAVLKSGPEDYFAAFNVWLHYLPSTHKMIQEGAGFWEIMEAEMRTRGRESLDMIKAYKQLGLICPVFMGGDFNSGSHLDWTIKNASKFGGYYLPWPVSRTMRREGFFDAYYETNSEAPLKAGFTWSPRFKDVLQYRIDYIYHDQNWLSYDAGIEGYTTEGWPSDHAMVWAVLVRSAKARP